MGEIPSVLKLFALLFFRLNEDESGNDAVLVIIGEKVKPEKESIGAWNHLVGLVFVID